MFIEFVCEIDFVVKNECFIVLVDKVVDVVVVVKVDLVEVVFVVFVGDKSVE